MIAIPYFVIRLARFLKNLWFLSLQKMVEKAQKIAIWWDKKPYISSRICTWHVFSPNFSCIFNISLHLYGSQDCLTVPPKWSSYMIMLYLWEPKPNWCLWWVVILFIVQKTHALKTILCQHFDSFLYFWRLGPWPMAKLKQIILKIWLQVKVMPQH